jgi:hypothetical protein
MGVLAWNNLAFSFREIAPYGIVTSDTWHTEMGVLAWINSAFSFRMIAFSGIIYFRYVADRDGCTGVDQSSIFLQCHLLSRFRSIQNRYVAASSPSDR